MGWAVTVFDPNGADIAVTSQERVLPETLSGLVQLA
jgi:hypothetical protein